MKCEEFNPAEASDLFRLVNDVRRFWRNSETVMGYIGFIDFEKLDELGLRAIELYCHVTSNQEENDSMLDYLGDPKNLDDKELDKTLKGMRILNSLIRQDKYRSAEML